MIVREAGELDGTNSDLEAWLTSDAVLRAALTNADWPELTEGSTATDQTRLIAALRDRLSPPRSTSRMNRPVWPSPAPLRGSVVPDLARELAVQVADHFEPQRQELTRRQTEENLKQLQERLRLARDAAYRYAGSWNVCGTEISDGDCQPSRSEPGSEQPERTPQSPLA